MMTLIKIPKKTVFSKSFQCLEIRYLDKYKVLNMIAKLKMSLAHRTFLHTSIEDCVHVVSCGMHINAN